MEFKETKTFTRWVTQELDDDEYALLQNALQITPALGPVIPKGGGLRKVRWGRGTTGKQGGVRVIYYWVSKDDLILFLLGYGKDEQDDLSSKQLKLLRSLVKEEYK